MHRIDGCIHVGRVRLVCCPYYRLPLALLRILGQPAGSPQMHTTTDNADIRIHGGIVSGDTMDICIIGGGVSGLSVLQVIMGTPQYKSGRWKPTLFEARDRTGGIWQVHHPCYAFLSVESNQ